MSGSSAETVLEKVELLRRLHAGSRMLVMPNAWDAASARAFAAAGFPAIATTSGGVAASLGFPDHEGAPLEEMLAAAARIVAAVAVPVTVDFEAGYGLEPSEIVERLVGAGASGLNIEDTDHHGKSKLIDTEKQAERLAAIKAAARATGVDLVLNARIDVFIQRLGSAEGQLADALNRAQLYRQAGADCVFPITLADKASIEVLIKTAQVVNINLRRGGPLSLEDAAALGVRRVTYATSIFRETLAGLQQTAHELKAQVGAVT